MPSRAKLAASTAASREVPWSIRCTTSRSHAQLAGATRAPHCSASPQQLRSRWQFSFLHLPHKTQLHVCAAHHRRNSLGQLFLIRARSFSILHSSHGSSVRS